MFNTIAFTLIHNRWMFLYNHIRTKNREYTCTAILSIIRYKPYTVFSHFQRYTSYMLALYTYRSLVA